MLTFKQLRELREALKPAIDHLHNLSRDGTAAPGIATKALQLLDRAESLGRWTLAAEDRHHKWGTEDR